MTMMQWLRPKQNPNKMRFIAMMESGVRFGGATSSRRTGRSPEQEVRGVRRYRRGVSKTCQTRSYPAGRLEGHQ